MGKTSNKPTAPDPEPDRCLRCGRCCYEKIRVGDVVVITDIPCPHLDAATSLCSVYEERFRNQPKCAPAAVAAASGAMPGDCPYARDLPGYRHPVRLADHPEFFPDVDMIFPGRSKLANQWLAADRP